jgi:hypothetical protein
MAAVTTSSLGSGGKPVATFEARECCQIETNPTTFGVTCQCGHHFHMGPAAITDVELTRCPLCSVEIKPAEIADPGDHIVKRATVAGSGKPPNRERTRAVARAHTPDGRRRHGRPIR